jgi:HK97 family phage portal protein
LEVHGCAYWRVERDEALGLPRHIWVLPAQHVSARRRPGGPSLVDWYEFRSAEGCVRVPPEEVVHFRFPDPRDPYTGGLSPLRACFEQATLASQYALMKRAIYDNKGLPGVVLSPDGFLAPDERARLETEWNQRFRGGGTGRVLVGESSLKVNVLSHSMGDLAALADLKATKEDIANAFHVPLPFLSGDTNLANMQAADRLHRTVAICPRLRRRDEKLNEQLIPFYDTTGRLFVASEDPTPAVQEHLLKMQELDLKYGVRTVNEVRGERGLPPVPWGDKPTRP